jgi:hypothetical protein
MRYTLMVFSSPVAGKEDEYNAWYSGQHVSDLLRVPGVVAARRLQFSPVQFTPNDTAPARYLALYEIDTNAPADVFADILARTGTADMVMSDAIDMTSVSTMVFKAL